MIVIRSLLFYIGAWLSTITVIVVGAPLVLFPFKIRYGFIRQWARFNIWTLDKVCHIRYVVKGRENIPESNGIIFCKHQSTWETLALQCVFPPQVWLLKKELLFMPFFGWGLAMLEPIAIDRSKATKALKQLIEQGTQRLKRGRWVVIFPEGTRTRPGTTSKYHKGGAVLAEKSGFPVVPVAHNGGQFWRYKQFLKHPGTVQMIIGPAIDVQGKTANEINEVAKKWIENEMQQIVEPA